VDQLFDSIAIRVDGPKAWDVSVAIHWVFTDLGHTYRTELSHGVLIQDVDPDGVTADLTLTLTKPQLIALLTGRGGLDSIATDGDLGAVQRLLTVLDPPNASFAIVTP
jgi:alkyl sulfatase BDS1-like metallo-beta-lactamase superfamily hydrolase